MRQQGSYGNIFADSYLKIDLNLVQYTTLIPVLAIIIYQQIGWLWGSHACLLENINYFDKLIDICRLSDQNPLSGF